ncbi:MAG: hypothetical protein OXJ52_09565 [Oligoflexia bacterium]|nr:hypothetical protein [Oligoflexia bacterium]
MEPEKFKPDRYNKKTLYKAGKQTGREQIKKQLPFILGGCELSRYGSKNPLEKEIKSLFNISLSFAIISIISFNRKLFGRAIIKLKQSD